MSEKKHYWPDGTEVTEEAIEQLADRFENAELDDGTWKPVRVGRPTLSGGRGESPRISVRVAPDVLERAKTRAEHEGRKLSDVARELIERYAG